MTELKGRDAELEVIHPLRYYKDMAAAVSKLRHKIEQVLMETQTNKTKHLWYTEKC